MGAEVVIDVGDFARVIGADIQRMEQHLREQVAVEVAARAEARAVQLTDSKGAVHLGYFKLMWRSSRTSQGAEVSNSALYAGVIEFGRRPKRPGPPLQPIVEWVRRKLIPNGAVVPEEGETVEEAALRVGAAIRRSIHERGTKPRRILGQVNDELPEMVRAALLRTFRRRRISEG